MRSPTIARRTAPGVNMTPMIDVSFLLIVFFIVSSHLAQQEIQQELELPRAATGRLLDEETERRVIVNVDAQGEITIAGDTITADGLAPRIAAERARAGDDLEVRIRSDRTVPYRYVEPILLACSRAGVWRVTFAVYRRDQR